MSADTGAKVISLASRRRSQPIPFTVSVRNDRGRLILEPEGELDLASGPELELALRIALSDGKPPRSVIILMDRVNFIDVAGVRALDRCAALVGGELSVGLLRPQARRLLTLFESLQRTVIA